MWYLLAAAVSTALASGSSVGAWPKVALAFPFEGSSSFLFRWDETWGSLIFYRQTTDPTAPAIKVYTPAGMTTFAPLRDFPRARQVSIRGVACAPNGGVIVAGVVHRGDRQFNRVLLTYGANGTLQKLWDIDPYEHYAVATDRDGNVYALGMRVDVVRNGANARRQASYPLLIKYSPRGKVLTEALSSHTLPDPVELVEGVNGLFPGPDGESAAVYLGSRKEVLWIDNRGHVSRRASLEGVLRTIRDETGSSRVEISALQPTASHILCQVRLWSEASNQKPSLVVLKVVGDSWLRVQAPEDAGFLGVRGGNELLFLRTVSDDALELISVSSNR